MVETSQSFDLLLEAKTQLVAQHKLWEVVQEVKLTCPASVGSSLPRLRIDKMIRFCSVRHPKNSFLQTSSTAPQVNLQGNISKG